MATERYLSEIYIYPIKSLPGIRVDRAIASTKGLQHDRRWMLVDSDLNFITIRKERLLTQFYIEEASLGYDVQTDFHKSSIQIPFELEDGEELKVKVWDDEVVALEGKQGWNDWFSEALRKPVTLVYMPEAANRPIKEKWQVNNESVSFADGYPYLIVGQPSLDRLNQKLDVPIGVHRFRPNLVFKNGEPFEEFYWKDVMVGDVQFKGLKPCERCVVTTIDIETGEAGLEPLKTLATQKIDGKVVFGQHALALSEGEIKVGDTIGVVNKKNSPYDPL